MPLAWLAVFRTATVMVPVVPAVWGRAVVVAEMPVTVDPAVPVLTTVIRAAYLSLMMAATIVFAPTAGFVAKLPVTKRTAGTDASQAATFGPTTAVTRANVPKTVSVATLPAPSEHAIICVPRASPSPPLMAATLVNAPRAGVVTRHPALTERV